MVPNWRPQQKFAALRDWPHSCYVRNRCSTTHHVPRQHVEAFILLYVYKSYFQWACSGRDTDAERPRASAMSAVTLILSGAMVHSAGKPWTCSYPRHSVALIAKLTSYCTCKPVLDELECKLRYPGAVKLAGARLKKSNLYVLCIFFLLFSS